MFVGNGVGIEVGLLVAPFVGSIVLLFVGNGVGFDVGSLVAPFVGSIVLAFVGSGVGLGVLPSVEATVDERVGLGDGLKLEAAYFLE